MFTLKSSRSSCCEMVLLPDPLRPVSQTIAPLWPLRSARFAGVTVPSLQKMFCDLTRVRSV